MSLKPIYADFASSAPPLPEVVDAMLEWLGHRHANPHATHLQGQHAAKAVQDAKLRIAELIDADPAGVIFTSGATESNNLAIKGLAAYGLSHIFVSALDHASIIEPAKALNAQFGTAVYDVPHDVLGLVDTDFLAGALRSSGPDPCLIAISHGNSEIGAIQRLDAISVAAQGGGHLLHVDASQTAAHVRISANEIRPSSLSLSAHKLYGPAGIGALWVDPHLDRKLVPQIHGGGQQGGLRSGTIPTYLAVGFGVAADLARRAMTESAQLLESLTNQLMIELHQRGLRPNLIGPVSGRLPGHLSLRFPGVDALDLLDRLLPKLSISTGSACSAGELRASRVLRALGLTEQEASEGLRFSLGRTSTPQEVSLMADYVSDVVKDLEY